MSAPAATDASGTDPLAPLAVCEIGASAGGLEALQQFFDNTEPDSGVAYVVVQHLSPDHKSLMVELLRRHTACASCGPTTACGSSPTRCTSIRPRPT